LAGQVFDLADELAFSTPSIDLALVVVGTEVVVAGLGIGQ
jgi:hypothetical protein